MRTMWMKMHAIVPIEHKSEISKYKHSFSEVHTNFHKNAIWALITYTYLTDDVEWKYIFSE